MSEKRVIDRWIGLLLAVLVIIMTVISCGLQPEPVLGTSESGEIWLGFMAEESGSEGGRSAGSDRNHAYGIFQFDDRYDLIPFLGHCLEQDPVKYEKFERIYTKYAPIANSGKTTVSSDSSDTEYLIQAWHDVYDADPEGFTSLQITYFVADYYGQCHEGALKQGIDLSDEEKYSPVIRGTLMSISIWAGQYDPGVQTIIKTLRPDMTEEEMLDKCYSMTTANLKKGKYHSAYVERWTRSQKARAAEDYARWKAGQEIFTSESTDLESMLSTSGGAILRGIDGGSYADYIKGWNEKYPELSKGFKESGGWNRDNKDWAIVLRSVDFWDTYKIKGGAPDFQEGASSGIWWGGLGSVDVNVENLTIPAVEYNLPDGVMPVVYYTQSAGSPWASVPFGGGTISSSGCSITSLAMALTYIKCGSDISDASKIITPDKIVNQIAAHNGGDYNHYYAGDSGQSWEIFPGVAEYYGVTCNQINSDSLIAALQAGHPVIISTSGPKSVEGTYGIFTQRGHFICATGYDPATGYIYVNDPNGSHSSYSAQGFTLATIRHESKGYWELY